VWCKNDPTRHPESDKKIRLRLRLPVLLGIRLHPKTSTSYESATLAKIPENLGKMALNVFRKTSEVHVLEVTPKNRSAKLHNKFLGKFEKIWAKILCTPKNLLAPTPILSLNSFHFLVCVCLTQPCLTNDQRFRVTLDQSHIITRLIEKNNVQPPVLGLQPPEQVPTGYVQPRISVATLTSFCDW